MSKHIWNARIALAKALLHVGWKILGAHVSPGRVVINGKVVEL